MIMNARKCHKGNQTVIMKRIEREKILCFVCVNNSIQRIFVLRLFLRGVTQVDTFFVFVQEVSFYIFE